MLFLSNLIYRREFNRAYAVSGIYPLMQVTNTPTHQLLSPFKNARQTLFDHLAWEDIRHVTGSKTDRKGNWTCFDRTGQRVHVYHSTERCKHTTGYLSIWLAREMKMVAINVLRS